MERHDDPATGARRATPERDAAHDQRNEGGASPEQPGEGGFETGSEHGPDTPAEEREPNFARGIGEDPPEGGRKGRFSDGEEELPDTPDKNVERRFSEGIEESPTSD